MKKYYKFIITFFTVMVLISTIQFNTYKVNANPVDELVDNASNVVNGVVDASKGIAKFLTDPIGTTNEAIANGSKYALESIIYNITKSIGDFVYGIKSSILTISNPFTSTVLKKYNTTAVVAGSLVVLVLIFCLITIVTSREDKMIAKSVDLFWQMIFVVVMLSIFRPVMTQVLNLANAFSLMWAKVEYTKPDTLLEHLMAGLNQLGTLTNGIFGLFIILSVLIIVIIDIIITNALKILMIVAPLIIILYPIDKFKNIVSRYFMLIGSLLMLKPLQSLVLGLYLSTKFQVPNASISDIISYQTSNIGMLIILIFFLPGTLFWVFSAVSSHKGGS